MNPIMRSFCLPMITAPVLAFAAPQEVGPTTKTVSPCGAKVLPLSVGNQWTYSLLPSGPPADPQIARIAPVAPDTVVVTVKAISSAPNGNTLVTLEEKSRTNLSGKVSDAGSASTTTQASAQSGIDERTIETSITCSATKFDLPPDSFWFSGEPGGSLGLQLSALSRPKGTSFQLTGGRFSDEEWREDLVALWTRVPLAGSEAKPSSGKLELERRFTPQQPETVKTNVGSYRAEKLGLITTGRVALDHVRNAKPAELPAGWVSTLWIAEGAGIVQTLNPFGRMYQLTAITLK